MTATATAKPKAAKTKATARNRAAAGGDSAVVESPAFQKGERVRVLSGDWGNSRGAVESSSGTSCDVRLDQDAHQPAGFVRKFERDNLVAINGERFDR